MCPASSQTFASSRIFLLSSASLNPRFLQSTQSKYVAWGFATFAFGIFVFINSVAFSRFDSIYFLDSIILSESLKSTQIEGTQISQDEMYFLKYMSNNDDKSEIENLKEVISYSKEYIKNNDII